ncbi:cytochrome c oxidase assembly protein, partial [Aquipuribacter hungaricus]
AAAVPDHAAHGSAVAGPAGHAAAHGAVAHMVQHVLLGMVVPVAVVAASPLRLLLALSPTRSRRPLARVLRSRAVHVLSHPVVAAVPVLVGLHVLLLTPLYAVSLQVGWVHGLVLAHTLLAGTWSALTLVGGDPAPARSSPAVRLGTLAVLAGAHAHLATLLYARAPALPPGAPSSAEELRDAALVLYHAGDAAELLLAAAVVLAWYRAGAGRARRAARPGAAGLVAAPG